VVGVNVPLIIKGACLRDIGVPVDRVTGDVLAKRPELLITYEAQLGFDVDRSERTVDAGTLDVDEGVVFFNGSSDDDGFLWRGRGGTAEAICRGGCRQIES